MKYVSWPALMPFQNGQFDSVGIFICHRLCQVLITATNMYTFRVIQRVMQYQYKQRFRDTYRTYRKVNREQVLLFIYFWLCWVFVAVHGLSLVVAKGGYSLLRCTAFSLRWLLLLRSMGSRCTGFSSCGMLALERRLSSCGAQAQLLRSMWDLPGPGLEPMSPALAGGFFFFVCLVDWLFFIGMGKFPKEIQGPELLP